MKKKKSSDLARVEEAIKISKSMMQATKHISFDVFGEPVAKGRPRFCRRGSFIGTYTPAKTASAENDFKLQALKYKPAVPWEGEIELSISVFRSIPKSFSRKRAAAAAMCFIRPATRPDLDNYVKLVCDAMNCFFWKDDSQVVSCKAEKFYSDTPHISVALKLLPERGSEAV